MIFGDGQRCFRINGDERFEAAVKLRNDAAAFDQQIPQKGVRDFWQIDRECEQKRRRAGAESAR